MDSHPLSPGDLPNLGIKPGSPALQADSLPSEPPGKPYVVWFVVKKKKKEVISFLLDLYLTRRSLGAPYSYHMEFDIRTNPEGEEG